ncbi:MAG: hypothetical protein IJT87_05750 [Ruminiclostridium sp.]|nr:hypothetical protein [Ruminiclostridium sp.]
MKRKIMFTAAILSAALLCSCSQNAPDSKQQALINEIVSDAKSVTLATEKPAEEAAAAPERETTASLKKESSEPVADYDVDIDLTEMNPTMIYATVYDIVTEPEQYLGKTLKVNGFFDTGYDESLDTRYYFVVIPDATACCLQGLEFKADGRNYPDDYPETRTDICVRGTLDKYNELGNDYYYIKTDMLVET